MIDSDKKEFMTCMVGIADIYQKSLTPESLKLYWNILKKYDLDGVVNAFNRHVSSADVGQYMPKPADIIKIIDGGGYARSAIAWSQVEKALRQVGTYQSVVFDDPIIHIVLSDMGGWILLGNITEQELPFKAREFEKRYSGYLLRDTFNYPKKLMGLSESHNETEGQKIEPPVFIGDAKKAVRVMEGGGAVALQVTNGIELPNLSFDR